MPTSGGIGGAVRDGKAIGCTAVQVFTSSPRQWKSAPITPEKIADFKKALTETSIEKIVCHDSYLINLAAPEEEHREKCIQGLTDEVLRCEQYGIPHVVSHMGAHMGQGTEVGLRLVTEAAIRILDSTPDGVTILMETTAGQGSSLNSSFEEISTILEGVSKSSPQAHRLAVCLDTCHIFAAGYDIRTEETYHETFDKFEKLIGFDKLKVVHCNDSKKKLGTRIDRHENLGEGEIGALAFQLLLNDPRFADIPIIVETPIEDDGHKRNVSKLWGWCNQ